MKEIGEANRRTCMQNYLYHVDANVIDMNGAHYNYSWFDDNCSCFPNNKEGRCSFPVSGNRIPM